MGRDLETLSLLALCTRSVEARNPPPAALLEESNSRWRFQPLAPGKTKKSSSFWYAENQCAMGMRDLLRRFTTVVNLEHITHPMTAVTARDYARVMEGYESINLDLDVVDIRCDQNRCKRVVYQYHDNTGESLVSVFLQNTVPESCGGGGGGTLLRIEESGLPRIEESRLPFSVKHKSYFKLFGCLRPSQLPASAKLLASASFELSNDRTLEGFHKACLESASGTSFSLPPGCDGFSVKWKQRQVDFYNTGRRETMLRGRSLGGTKTNE